VIREFADVSSIVQKPRYVDSQGPVIQGGLQLFLLFCFLVLAVHLKICLEDTILFHDTTPSFQHMTNVCFFFAFKTTAATIATVTE